MVESQNNTSELPQRQLSGLKVLFFYVLMLAITLVILEIGVRAIFAFRVGPSVLLYGTSFERQNVNNDRWANMKAERTATVHENQQEGYSKYFPNQIRHEVDGRTGERFSITINNRGFRGDNFDNSKAPGTIRIVTLGASSTFGFYNRDHETYPYQLESILNNESNHSYEVINLGVPHLLIANILQLFETEALPLNPDIITFYEGNNDASEVLKVLKQSRETESQRFDFEATMIFAGRYSVAVGLLNSIMGERLTIAPRPLKDIDAAAEIISESFLLTLQIIADECAKRNITFIVASQQRRSLEIDRDELKSITFQEEQNLIREQIANGKPLKGHAIKFVAHATLKSGLLSMIFTLST